MGLSGPRLRLEQLGFSVFSPLMKVFKNKADERRQAMLEIWNNAGVKPRTCRETPSSGAKMRGIGLDQD